MNRLTASPRRRGPGTREFGRKGKSGATFAGKSLGSPLLCRLFHRVMEDHRKSPLIIYLLSNKNVILSIIVP
jgi:hypothetical protein